MNRVHAKGMMLVEGDQRFVVRGVSYGPFRPNAQGEPFTDKARFERDAEILRALGANVLRVYHVPPTWMVELCEAFELRLMVGVPWEQHIRFLDSATTRSRIRDAIRDGAAALRGRESMLSLLIGNEVPPQVVRWYGARRVETFLGELADVARQADAETMVSYANFPMTEYLELGFLDFSCFNVYLHRAADLRAYLARLQNLAAFRPLVLSEFGADSFRESNEGQARILGQTLDAVDELGCAGSVVFSFTDEWHTGGHDIEDWAFGLVSAEREPKPAFDTVRDRFRTDGPTLPDAPPRVSVVVCAYNAERTLEECLDSLRLLRYPDFEVIVVDDGSTDRTRAIAERYPEFRLISHENRGLSVARNDGLAAATGDVIAYTDSDCAVHSDWLSFLVLQLLSGDYVGVGGPNLPPAEADWVPEAVARSPGGPTHVLLTDEEAEHVPGCNMAFWRDSLREIGGFDPTFHAAGDDIDICWRLQDRGGHIGYAASALVWHRRRSTVAAYLKQQRGYGEAEGMLYFKHPYRFNELGQSRWLGRIYADLGRGLLSERPRIHSGQFGSGLFQTLYQPTSSLISHLPVTLEWNAAALALIVVGLLSSTLFGVWLPMLAIAGLLMVGISVGQALSTALRVDVEGLPRWRARGLIAVLNYLGPFLRAVARHRFRHAGARATLPKVDVASSHEPTLEPLYRRFSLAYWNDSSVEKQECLSVLIDYFEIRKYPVVLDDGWQGWDLSVLGGAWIRGELGVLVENHGGEQRQIDVGVRLRHNAPAKLTYAAGAATAIIGVASGSVGTTLFGLTLSAAMAGLFAYHAWRLGRVLHHAIGDAFRDAPLVPLPRRPASHEPAA